MQGRTGFSLPRDLARVPLVIRALLARTLLELISLNTLLFADLPFDRLRANGIRRQTDKPAKGKKPGNGKAGEWKNRRMEEPGSGRPGEWKSKGVEDPGEWKTWGTEEPGSERAGERKSKGMEDLGNGRTEEWKSRGMEDLGNGRAGEWMSRGVEEPTIRSC